MNSHLQYNILLSHSCYSFLQGVSQPEELITISQLAEYSGIGLTDFDGFYGLANFFNAYKKLSSGNTSLRKNFKLIYGVELLYDIGKVFENIGEASFEQKQLASLINYRLRDANGTPVFLQNRICYLAPNFAAYEQLCSLVTYAHKDNKVANAINFSDSLVPIPNFAIAILPSRGISQLFSPKETHLFNAWLKKIEQLHDLHKGKFYLSLTQASSSLEYNAFLNHLEASRLLNIPLVATDDVFFALPQQKTIHDALTSIKMNQTLEESKWACFPNTCRHINTSKNLKTYFANSSINQEALANNIKIGNLCSFSLSEIRYQYPSEFIPSQHTPLTFLTYLTNLALHKKYPNSLATIDNGCNIPERMHTLVSHELKLIGELNFADYFLTVWDIVQFAKKHQILYQGRGSAANSAVCFLLEITPVNPMISDVLFERFLNKERGDPPDIDIDFEHERREEVIQYIYKRYGKSRAAMVANVVCFKSKRSIRETGKILGISEEEIKEIIVSQADLKLLGKRGEKYKLWADLAGKIYGLPRHLGIHSGGVVITQNSLMQLSPVEPAKMPNRFVIQWNKDDIESLGIFKIDVLSLGMLTALRKTFSYLKATNKRIPGTLIPINLRNIPENCEKTYTNISQGKTTGVFQIESRAQMALLPRLKPKCFYDLVISIGIIRPGPIISGMVPKFLNRHLGLEPIFIPHERLKPILLRTLGVPIFQEQIIRIVMEVANFTPGEADDLRRSMGAWKLTGDIKKYEAKLKLGMEKNNISKEFADIIYKQIEGFSQYGFPEAHATSFAFLAYASAWLKTHYPAEFLCGLLNSQPLGFYSVHSLLQEAKHNKINIVSPCLFISEWDSNISKLGVVKLGFRIISHLQEKHVAKFLLARKKLSISKYSKETDIFAALSCFTSLEKIVLAVSGAFNAYNKNRRDILWKILANPSTLVEDDLEASSFALKAPAFEAWDNAQDDIKTMRTTFAEHPLTIIKNIAWQYPISISTLVLAKQVYLKSNNSKIAVAGLVIIKQCPPTAKGMVFITIEDETGTINLILKPKIFEKYRRLILTSGLLCVKGILESQTTATVMVTEIVPKMDLATENQSQTQKGLSQPPEPIVRIISPY